MDPNPSFPLPLMHCSDLKKLRQEISSVTPAHTRISVYSRTVTLNDHDDKSRLGYERLLLFKLQARSLSPPAPAADVMPVDCSME